MLLKGMTVACAVLLLQAAVANAGFVVAATGYSSMDYGVTRTPFDITTVTNSNGSKSITGSGFNQEATIGSPVIVSAFSGGEVEAFAGPGILRAKLDTSALIHGIVPWQPQVAASVGATFTDSFLVESSTLAVGTPVEAVYTLHIDGLTNAPPFYSGFGYPQGTVVVSLSGDGISTSPLVWPPPFAPSTGVPAAISLNIPFNVSTTVGATLLVDVGLSLASFNRANFGYGDTQETHMDFSHTVQLFADPLTSNFRLTSLSGHDYSTNAVNDPSPVPEPSMLILALSFGLTTWVGRRARTPRCTDLSGS